MDESIGKVLETSLRKDLPKGKLVAKDIVSKPTPMPTFKKAKSQPKITVETIRRPQETIRESVVSSATKLVEHLTLAEHFYIDRPTPDQSEKLKVIYDYCLSQNPRTNPERTLMSVERKVGQPRLGESTLDRVYRWIRLRDEASLIDEKMKMMRR